MVVPSKENSMTTENDAFHADLRAWMKSPAIGLPEYSDDHAIQRRVGKMLAETFRPVPASETKPSVRHNQLKHWRKDSLD
jgi:hypothetical protein